MYEGIQQWKWRPTLSEKECVAGVQEGAGLSWQRQWWPWPWALTRARRPRAARRWAARLPTARRSATAAGTHTAPRCPPSAPGSAPAAPRPLSGYPWNLQGNRNHKSDLFWQQLKLWLENIPAQKRLWFWLGSYWVLRKLKIHWNTSSWTKEPNTNGQSISKEENKVNLNKLISWQSQPGHLFLSQRITSETASFWVLSFNHQTRPEPPSPSFNVVTLVHPWSPILIFKCYFLLIYSCFRWLSLWRSCPLFLAAYVQA